MNLDFSVFWTRLEPLVIFSILVAVGILLRVTKVLKREDSKPLNNLILKVALPALIFKAVIGVELSFDLVKVVGVGLLVLPVMLLLSWLMCSLIKPARPLKGAVFICVVWANTGYIGLPLTQAFFGDQYLATSAFYDVFVTVIPLFLIGVPIAAHFGSSGGRKNNPFLELIRMPPVLSLVFALVVKMTAITLPAIIFSLLNTASAIAAPLIMISVGLSLYPGRLSGNLGLVFGICSLRLIVAPLVAFSLGLLLIEPGVFHQIVTLQASMPVIMLSLVFAQRYKLDEGFVATTIFISICLSAITIPLLQTLLF